MYGGPTRPGRERITVSCGTTAGKPVELRALQRPAARSIHQTKVSQSANSGRSPLMAAKKSS